MGDNAWVVRNVLSVKEAAAMAAAAETHGFEQATSWGPKFGEAIRNHGRAAFEDGPLAKALWNDTGLAAAITYGVGSIGGKASTGLNPALRVYSYAVDEVFGAHFDESTDTNLVGRDFGKVCGSSFVEGYIHTTPSVV